MKKQSCNYLRKLITPLSVLMFLVISIMFTPTAKAVPSDAQMRQDLNSKGIISIKFLSNGSKRLENLKYVWLRDVEIVRTADIPELPGVKLVVTGTAVYDIIGGKFSYVTFRVSGNSYLGIPNPKVSDIKALIDKNGTEQLVGNGLYNDIVSEVKYEISSTPKWEWHTPKSVSFNVVTRFDVLSNTGSAVNKVEYVFRVRFYADAIKGPWKSMLTSTEEEKILSSKTVSRDEYEKLKQESTLAMLEAKKKAESELNKLPKVNIPEFKTDADIILYTYKMLREASAGELESYLIQVLAPSYFLPGSNVMLTNSGAELINKSVNNAHKLNITFKEAYCENPTIAHQQSGMMQFFSKANQGKTRIAVSQYGGGYKEGVLAGQTWKIHDLLVHIPNSKAEVDYIRSFSDPNKLCAKVSPVANTSSAMTWKSQDLNDISMTISFPDGNPVKSVNGKQYSYILSHATGTYMISAWKFGRKLSDSDAISKIEIVANNFAKNVKFSITDTKDYSYGTDKGREYTMVSGNNIVRCKSVFVGEILYQILISSTKSILTSDIENQFFGSFVVNK